jgi:2-polyprenyl-3-methyl-5-hydroxy-6-metoxy-1,4-benzoquinol methylase
MPTEDAPRPDPEKLNRKVALIAGMMTGAHVAAMIILGLRLGLYKALAGAGPVTSDSLSEATGLRERWLREWLRGQASAGIVEYRGEERFELSTEAALLLVDENSLSYLGANFLHLPDRMAMLEHLQQSFRTGIGYSLDDRGAAAAEASGQQFANWHRQALVPMALPMLEGVVARLEAGAVAADVGCGSGVAVIEMAKAFPRSRFHGYDTSRQALALAASNRAAAHVENASFHDPSKEPLPADASVDFITTFDCLHDMTHPEDVVAAIRAAIKPDGVWFIVDINGAPTFEEQLGRANAPMLYAMSVLSCMSSALSEDGGAGLGTLGLPEPAMRALVESAGFSRFRRIDLPHPINAFYEVRP